VVSASIQGDLGEDLPDQARELERVARTDRDEHLVVCRLNSDLS